MAAVKTTGEKNKERRKHRLPGIVLSVALLAVVSAAAAVMITNDGRLDLDGLRRLLDGIGSKPSAAVFSFDAGSGAVYADMGGGLAVCSSTGLQVFDRDAGLSYAEAFEMSSPTICSGGDSACVYDLGGSAVKVFDGGGVLYGLTAENKIISAALNENGWLALCTESSGIYRGKVSVYGPSGKNAYNFYSAPGYVLSAAVSPDNKGLAVLMLDEQGSRIAFYSLDSTDEKASCRLDGELMLDIRYLSGGSISAVGDGALLLVRPDGGSQRLLGYTDRYLMNFSMGSAFTALVLNDYMVGDQGCLMTVDKSGNTLGTLATARKVLWLSSSGDGLAVLYSDGLVIYDKYLKEQARFDDTAGAVCAVMRDDGTALLITAHSATVCDPSD